MKILKLVTLCLMISMFAGCSVSEQKINVASSSSNKNSEINSKEEEKKQEERSKQTLWTVLDKDGNDKEMLTSNDNNVEQIIDVIEKHCLLVDNRDFNKLNVEDEYNLYSENFIKALEKGNYKESVQSMYKNNKLALKYENLIWYRNYFNEDITTCKVTVESEFTIKEANKDYLDKNKMNLDEVYQEKRTYYLEKVENKWKIVNIEKSPLTKRSKTA
ncbi:hypothetical protein [Faecalimicrobium sp. JNUCC 81]